MKRIITLLLGWMCLMGSVHSSELKVNAPDETEANIVGHVLDVDTRQHLSGARVSLKGTNFSAVTDASGHYFLKDVPVGKHTMEVRRTGYEMMVRAIEIHEHQTLTEDFEISEAGNTLEDVVVSASRNATKRKLAPSLVNVLDGKAFSLTQSTDVAQGLKFQPGVRVETNCQNCGFSQVRINGLEGSYSQILIDSRPVFSALAGVYGLEQIPTNMIERVEVIRGGGSALFGSNAVAGVINIITKEPSASSASASHTLRGLGGFHAFENVTSVNGTYVAENGRLGMSLFGQMRHRSGYDHDKDGYTEMPVLDGRTLGARVFFRPTQWNKISAELHNTHEFRRGGDRLKEEPHNAHVAEQLRHRNLTGSVDFTQYSKDNKYKMNAYGSFAKVTRESYYGGGTPLAELLALGNALTEENAKEMKQRMASYGHTEGETFLLGMQHSYAFDRLIFSPAELTAGLEYHHDRLSDRSGYRPSAIRQSVNTKSLFVQNEWRAKQWSFLVGGRLDRHSLLRKAVFSPRANVRFSPDLNTVFRIGYSAGFRAPQIFDEDLHVDNAGGELILSENAPGLKEERSHSLTLSGDWYAYFGGWQVNLTGEGFFTALNDAFSFEQQTVKTGTTSYLRKLRTNSEGARVFGLNLEGRISYRNLAQLQGGVTLQQSRWNKAQRWNEDDAFQTRRMYRTPNTYAYFMATVNVTGRWAVSLSGNYTGSMLAGHEIPTEKDGTLTMFNGAPAAKIATERLRHGAGQTAETYGPRTFRTPSFFELGTKVTCTIPVYKYYSVEVSAGVQNLFNAYQKDFDRGPSRDSAYIYGPMSPRSFFAGFKINY